MGSSRGFLDLPSAVRRRIYCEAGLVTDAEVALHYQGRAERRRKGLSVPDLGPYTALVLVSRAVRVDVTSLLFSSNRFFIQYQAASEGVVGRDLAPLRRLPPAALSYMSFLTVHLHVAARKRGRHDVSKARSACPASKNVPLNSSSPQGQAALLEWQATLEHCSPHIRPGTLSLSLVCDVADVEMARHITAALDHLPALARCQIRLSNDPDEEQLLSIARDAAMRALQRKADRLDPSSNRPFRFMDLPQELRFHILRYTDLVTPYSMAVWDPRDGYSNGRGLFGSHDDLFGTGLEVKCKPPYDGCHPSAHEHCEGGQCLQDTKCSHSSTKCWICPHYGCQFHGCYARNDGQGCFCSRHHAAYSPLCDCWRPPTPLFLVSRAFCEDARAIFYSQNHFEINVARPTVNPINFIVPRPARHPASIFLRDTVPTSSLRHLRSLELHMLEFNSYPYSQDAAEQDWLRTIEYVKDRIHPRFVYLHVSVYESFLDWPDTMDFFHALAEEPNIDLVKTFVASFWPLTNLGSDRLQKLDVDLSLGDAEVGYYFRSRRRGLLDRFIDFGPRWRWDFKNERECRVLDHDDRGPKKTWVEGIRGHMNHDY